MTQQIEAASAFAPTDSVAIDPVTPILVDDAPEVVAVMIEEYEPQAPLGAKGIGEPPCISVTPAIVAAIRDAIAKDLHRIPVRPQDICL